MTYSVETDTVDDSVDVRCLCCWLLFAVLAAVRYKLVIYNVECLY